MEPIATHCSALQAMRPAARFRETNGRRAYNNTQPMVCVGGTDYYMEEQATSPCKERTPRCMAT